MTYFTYRGVEVPLEYAEAALLEIPGFNAWTEGIDAAFDSPTIARMLARAEEDPVVRQTLAGPREDTYTELTDGGGDAWFEIPGHPGRFTMWNTHESRKAAGRYHENARYPACSREEIGRIYGIASERQRTGDTQ